MKKSRIIITIILLLIIFIFFCFKNKDNQKEYSKEEVIISKESMATKEDTLSITMKTKKGYKIYYTLDGSIPDKKSKRYRRTIKLNKNSTPDNLATKENSDKIFGDGIQTDKNFPRAVVLRAIAIGPDGQKSEVITKTYFIGLDIEKYFKKATIISIVTDPENLLDYEKGIMVKGKIYDEWLKNPESESILLNPARHYLIEGNYTQKGKDWEREAVIEYFEGSNKVTWSQNGGIRLKGSLSRNFSQKSINIYFRKDYGDKSLKYDLFQNNVDKDNKEIKEYKSFSLRNGGNDKFLKFKDQLLQDLVKDRNVDTQAGKMAILFLNGEYWGVYVLQEKYSDDYYASHYNIDKDNIIVIKEDEVDEGKDEDIKLYNELMEYAKKDLSNNKIYKEFTNKVDIQSMIDYYAIQIYIGNTDWGIDNQDKITKNTQLWRVRETSNKEYEDGKWRWSLYDLEYSSSMYNQNTTSYDYNSIEKAKSSQPLFGSAMKNTEFKNAFYNTLKDIGKNYYSRDNINNYLDEYYNEWEEYYYNNDKRFSNYSTDRNYSIIKIKEYFDNRYDYITKVG